MMDRREWLSGSASVAALLAGTGLWPQTAQAAWSAAAFESKTPAEASRALGAAAPIDSREVTLTGPDIAENGAVVPVVAACSLPGVKRLLILIEKNPALLAAVFELSEAVEAQVSTRVKMSQTCLVYAVALMADGRALYAAKDIKVTLGGCGG